MTGHEHVETTYRRLLWIAVLIIAIGLLLAFAVVKRTGDMIRQMASLSEQMIEETQRPHTGHNLLELGQLGILQSLSLASGRTAEPTGGTRREQVYSKHDERWRFIVDNQANLLLLNPAATDYSASQHSRLNAPPG